MKTNQIKKLQLFNLIWRLRNKVREGFNDAWYGGKRISPTAQLKYVRWKIREAKEEIATL
jgi:hypothetical protein